MKQRKIFEDRKLNDVLFQTTERELVIPEGIKRVIPVLFHGAFALSVPYNISKNQSGNLVDVIDSFGSRDIFYQWKSMTKDLVKELTETYLEHHLLSFIGYTLTESNPAIYSEALPLAEGIRRNAFEAKGYYLKTLTH